MKDDRVNNSEIPDLEGCVVEICDTFERNHSGKLFSYWKDLYALAPDIGPQVDKVDLIDIIECTPYLMSKDLVEVDGEIDFRNRYWGTELVRAYGHEATGNILRDYYTGLALEQTLNVSNFIVSAIHAVKITGRLKFVDENRFVPFESCYVPFFNKNGSPARYMAAYDFI